MFSKWKEETQKKDIMDKIKDKLNNLLNKEKKEKLKQALDKLKKIKDKKDYNILIDGKMLRMK